MTATANAAVADCPLCGGDTVPAGHVRGSLVDREFTLRHCTTCRYSYVVDPVVDVDVYDERYYQGAGADPLVDYVFEHEHSNDTVRTYEWRGIHAAVSSLVPLAPGVRWLDYGCGTGGLLRHCRRQVPGIEAVGYESGWAAEYLRRVGDAVLSDVELDARSGSFDVVTAIEVLEHVSDPLAVLREIRRLLRPGGLFFYTTGNASRYRGRLGSWSYVRPEIHVSFFEPETMARALLATGFRSQVVGYGPGFEDIVRFKVLKNLHYRKAGGLERLIPWRVASRLVDRRFGVSAHPVGWAA